MTAGSGGRPTSVRRAATFATLSFVDHRPAGIVEDVHGTTALLAGVAAGIGVLAAAWLRAAVFRLSVPADTPDRTGCPGCGRPLLGHPNWWRSTLSPTGRCPGCRRRVGAPLGVLEIVAGALLGAVAGVVGPRPELAAFGVLALLCVALAAIDLAVHRLPDRLTLPAYPVLAALFVLAALVTGEPDRIVRVLLAGAALAGGYLLLALLRPGQLGLGDVKLAGLLGLALGWLGWDAVLLGTALAFVLCALAGLALLVGRRASLRTALPLGPFMVAGTFAVVLLSS